MTPQVQYEFAQRLKQENSIILREKLEEGLIKLVVHTPISRGGLSIGAVNEQGIESVLSDFPDIKNVTFPLQAESYTGEGKNKELENVWGIKEAIDFIFSSGIDPKTVLFNLDDDVAESNQTSAFVQNKLIKESILANNILAGYLFNKPSKRTHPSIEGITEFSLFDTTEWIIYAHELYDVGGEGPNSERVASIAFKDPIITDAIYGDPRLRRAVNEYLIDSRVPNLNRLYVQQLLLAKEIVMNDSNKRPFEKATGLVLTVYSNENIMPMGVTTHELMRLLTKDDKIPVIPHHGVVSMSPEGKPYLIGGNKFLEEVVLKLDSQGFAYQSPIRVRLMGLKDENTQTIKTEIGAYLKKNGFQLEF